MKRKEGKMARRYHNKGGYNSQIRSRFCYFCDNPNVDINYKNISLLKRYMSDRGKIVARRVSGNCAKHQRELARATKRARFLALVPFKVDIYR